MHVDPSTTSPVQLAATRAASAASLADPTLFSTRLAQASTKTLHATDGSSTSSSSDSSSGSTTSAKAPNGEKAEAVKGHAYSEIVAGPRNGMFLNTSGNSRDGDAFARVRRGGREFHIYGTGTQRMVVEVKHPDTSSDASSTSSGSDSTSDSASSASGSTATSTTGTSSG